MSQLKLKFDCEIKVKEKRVRFKPDWDKFYTVNMFDNTKYHSYMEAVANRDFAKLSDSEKELLQGFTAFQREEIKELCYVRDDDGNKKPLGDEHHIFRLKTLHKIYSKLYEYAHLNPLLANEKTINRLKYQQDLTLCESAIICRLKDLNNKGFKVNFDDDFGNTLEIEGTEMQSIKERLKAHLDLLRRLKRGEKL